MGEVDDELKALQHEAISSMRLAQGKIEFLAQHGAINPLAIIQSRVEWLVEWFIPSHVNDSGKRVEGMTGVPTNPDRLRFDIYCNERTIQECDEAMGQSGGGLHIVEGIGDIRDN